MPPSINAVMLSLRTSTPSTMATTGSRYVTVDATVAPSLVVIW